MKKLHAIATIFIVALILSACSKDNDSKPSNNTSPNDEINKVREYNHLVFLENGEFHEITPINAYATTWNNGFTTEHIWAEQTDDFPRRVMGFEMAEALAQPGEYEIGPEAGKVTLEYKIEYPQQNENELNYTYFNENQVGTFTVEIATSEERKGKFHFTSKSSNGESVTISEGRYHWKKNW